MIVEHLSQMTSTSTMTVHDISQRFVMHATLPGYITYRNQYPNFI